MLDQATATASARSRRGLDGINLLMADVRDGVGPFLSVFLKGSQHWDPGAIGLAMGASSLAAALCQIPAGLLVDAARAKRALVAGSGLMVGLGCLLIVMAPQFWTVLAAQVLLGSASAVIPPAIAALSLGLVGRHRLDGRISRNESFNHAGNLAAAVLAGGLGRSLGTHWIFYLVCAFAVASAAVVTLINPAEVDHERARGGEDPSHADVPLPLADLFRRRDLVIFLGSVVLFHFGNAAMLPMAGQVLAQTHPGTDAVALSACIIAAQFVMVAAAWGVGRASARGFGRKPIFLVALAVLPVRGLLFATTSSPYAVVAIQLLDGVAAGIFGVIAVLIASDLMQGTGRFNLAQGLTALSVGVGASLSNMTAGYVVQWFGYPSGFLYLTVIAGCALAFFALAMPETRDTVAGARAVVALADPYLADPSPADPHVADPSPAAPRPAGAVFDGSVPGGRPATADAARTAASAPSNAGSARLTPPPSQPIPPPTAGIAPVPPSAPSSGSAAGSRPRPASPPAAPSERA